MVNSVYLTLSCRESRLCLYIYFLKFLFIYLFILYAICQHPSRPPDTVSPRVPGAGGPAFSSPGLPQGVLHSPRAGVSVRRPAGHLHGTSAYWSTRGAQPGALGVLRGPGRPAPRQSSFFQLSYYVSSAPTTTQRDPFQIHQIATQEQFQSLQFEPQPSSEGHRTAGTSAHGAGATHLWPQGCLSVFISVHQWVFIPLRTGIPFL